MEKKVKYAWGMIAATPVQYVAWVLHCSSMSPLWMLYTMKGKVWIRARMNMAQEDHW